MMKPTFSFKKKKFLDKLVTKCSTWSNWRKMMTFKMDTLITFLNRT